MAMSRDGDFLHVQNGGWISPTGGSQGIHQRVGRSMTTKTAHIGEGSRLPLRRGNLSVRNPQKCGSGRSKRDEEMD